MRDAAIEYPAPGETRVVDIGPAPDPAAHEILIRTEYSGITNGTERHALLGEHGWKDQFPSRHGYQHVGRVEARGTDVSRFHVGDRVFFGNYVGHRGWNLLDVRPFEGPPIVAPLVVKLPDELNPVECALFGVSGVALRGIRRMRAGVGHKVWIAGAGLIGQFAAQAARVSGAHVTVTDINADRLERARVCGTHRVVNVREQPDLAKLAEHGPYNVIVDCCGVPDLLMEIGKHDLLAYRGVIGLLAVRMETRFVWGMMHGREASIEVSCHFSVDDLEALIQLLGTGAWRVEPLITHRASIDDAPAVYAALRDKPAEMLGVVFDWT